MNENWRLKSIEIKGGFLDDVSIPLPPGMTCIIGPRGSGKSTLAEAIRVGLGAENSASRQRIDLIKGNLSKSLITTTAESKDGRTFCIKREGRDSAIVATGEGTLLANVDLQRGTFLPIDVFCGPEIEELADESLGPKRRALVDQLRLEEMHEINVRLAEAKRNLDANSDQVRQKRRAIKSIEEQIDALADARDRLAGLPEHEATGDTSELNAAQLQEQYNRAESAYLAELLSKLKSLQYEADRVLGIADGDTLGEPPVEGKNAKQMLSIDKARCAFKKSLDEKRLAINEEATVLSSQLHELSESIGLRHQKQAAELLSLREKHKELGDSLRIRAELVSAVQRLDNLEAVRIKEVAQLESILNSRKNIKAQFLRTRDDLSALREETARHLTELVGPSVQVRVRRNADDLSYRNLLIDALKGSSVTKHDAIAATVSSSFRPDQLAQLIDQCEFAELEGACHFGLERSKKILQAFSANIDHLDLESHALEDRVTIELNVGTETKPNFKDASQLSSGQKCTALLPILLARRSAPLVIDQPEDNLDNHFIFKTVVESILRIKGNRQMVFITHNANIPVLGEADHIIVMESNGQRGSVRTSGSLLKCKDEIIDLLEGGEEAFEQRRKRYKL